MERETPKEVAARVATDAGGAFACGLAYIGERLGLFAALARGPATAAELARRCGLVERYVDEWLKGMVASRYVELDTERYSLSEAQAAVLAREGGAAFAAGQFQFAIASLRHVERVAEAFVEGGGVPFAELGPEVAAAIDRMHAPAFEHALVQRWLPAVPGLEARLAEGARVLDVGCGLGRSVRAIAAAWPRSRVTALEPDLGSLERARERCAGLDNVAFAPVTLGDLRDASPFDLVLAFDTVHDMLDPVAELRAARELLSADGRMLVVEPTGSTDPRENRDPAGRLRSCLSPFHCLTVSLAHGGAGLGTIIGEQGVRRLAGEAGFGRVERLTIDDALQQFFLLRP